MAKKEPKTNAMRILEKEKIQFEIHRYECEEFTDGVAIADTLGQPHEKVFKTLVTEGKSKEYFVFVIPIAEELDLKKAARAVGEKSSGDDPCEGHKQSHRLHKRRLHRHWDEKRLLHCG